MVQIDVSGYDATRLALWTVSDLAAIAWGLSAVTHWSPVELFGQSTLLVLGIVGVIGGVSLVSTWTDWGATK